MSKTLSQFTEEAVDDFRETVKNHLVPIEHLNHVEEFLTTAIAEAWSESQKWDAEAVKKKIMRKKESIQHTKTMSFGGAVSVMKINTIISPPKPSSQRKRRA